MKHCYILPKGLWFLRPQTIATTSGDPKKHRRKVPSVPRLRTSKHPWGAEENRPWYVYFCNAMMYNVYLLHLVYNTHLITYIYIYLEQIYT